MGICCAWELLGFYDYELWCLTDIAGSRLFADGEIILEVHKERRPLFYYGNVKGNEENSLQGQSRVRKGVSVVSVKPRVMSCKERIASYIV